MKKKLTFIYIYRNRDIERVKNSLDSLDVQTNSNFDVIFIDYGSNESISNAICLLLRNYSFCKYYYNESRGRPWNRSHAINSGIKLSTTEFIFTADVDLVYKSDFVEYLYSIMDINIAYFFTMVYLPKEKKTHQIGNINSLQRSSEDTLGQALLPVKSLLEIRGFDEFYSFWGLEDNDIKHRLVHHNIKCRFVHDVYLFHQWHPIFHSDFTNFPEFWHKMMSDYFSYMQSSVIRNKEKDWGILYSLNDRHSMTINANDIYTIELDTYKKKFVSYLLASFLISREKPAIKLVFNDITSQKYIKSNTGMLIVTLNRIFDRIKFPIKLVSRFRENYSTIYDIRDEVVYLIYQMQHCIEDYFIEMVDRKITIIIVLKKN